MIYELSHRTTFSYTQPVSISHHILHLTPRSRTGQTCLRSSLLVEPAPSVRSEGIDYYGNPVTFLTVQEPHDRLQVHASARVDVRQGTALLLAESPAWEDVAAAMQEGGEGAVLDACQYAYESPYVALGDGVLDFARECFPEGRPILEGAMELTARIFHEFEYRGGVTDVSTPVWQVLESRHGVCQDFAHLQIACLRSLGLPARYVSGYLLTHPPEGQEKLIGSDASHAWVSVWCPTFGWVDFDPTNNLVPGDEHITLAWGRDYGDVSPINGFMVGGGSHQVNVAVDVRPVRAA